MQVGTSAAPIDDYLLDVESTDVAIVGTQLWLLVEALRGQLPPNDRHRLTAWYPATSTVMAVRTGTRWSLGSTSSRDPANRFANVFGYAAESRT